MISTEQRMIKRIKRWLRLLANPEKNATVWDVRKHNSWGNAIQWTDFKARTLYGHTTPRPSVGDVLLCPMSKGGVYKFRFVKVELMHDPADMWFGTVEDVCYVQN